MQSLLVSVIIPTRNRPQALERCLDALAVQTMSPGSFEVLVVDDSSEPPLSLDPSRWVSKFDLKLIRQQNTAPAGARNRGVTHARGEFLAFTDDDCLPTPTWLEKLVAALRANPEAMVGGSTFNGLKENPYSETSQLILEMVYVHFNRDPANAYFFASNNMAIRRDSFLATGGFDVTLRTASEDRDLCDRWRMADRRLVWIEDAKVEHRHAQDIVRFTRLHFRYGQGAWSYNRLRKTRGTASVADYAGFHWSIPKRLLERRRTYSIPRMLGIPILLVWWELVNAVGFVFAAVFKK
jgi:GT2 family glycosyltransferase